MFQNHPGIKCCSALFPLLCERLWVQQMFTHVVAFNHHVPPVVETLLCVVSSSVVASTFLMETCNRMTVCHVLLFLCWPSSNNTFTYCLTSTLVLQSQTESVLILFSVFPPGWLQVLTSCVWGLQPNISGYHCGGISNIAAADINEKKIAEWAVLISYSKLLITGLLHDG